MGKFLQLQKYILKNDFQFSRLAAANHRDDRKHAALTLAGYCAAIVMALGYIVYIAFDLYMNNQSALFFPILSSILFWGLGIWTILSGIQKLVFSSDTDLIFSMPLPSWQAKLFNAGKLLILYFLIVAMTIVAGVMLHLFILPSLGFVLLSAIILIITLPSVVIAATFLISLAVKTVLNLLKVHSNIIEALLTITLFLSPLLYFAANASSLNYKEIFYSSSPLNLFGFINAQPQPEFPQVLSFLAISILFVLIACYLFIKQYDFLTAAYSTSRKTKARDSRAVSSNNLFKSLFSKELQLYLSSITYVSNTILTPALLLIGSLAYLFELSPLLTNYTLELSFISLSSKYIFILFTTVCILLTTTTSSSLSFEGRSIWIVLTSPLSLIELAKAKIALNILLFLPGLACAITVYVRSFSSSATESLLFISFTVSSLLLISIVGFFINLKFPNYNWSSEMEVIKQGKSTILTAMISMVLISAISALTIFAFDLTFPLLLLINICVIAWLIYKLKDSSLVLE